MNYDDSLLRRAYDMRFPDQNREETPRILQVLFGEIMPNTYADRPSYGDVLDVWPSYIEDVKAFTDNHIKGLVREWEASNPPESRLLPPTKDWTADPFAKAASGSPKKNWAYTCAPRGKSDGPG